MSSSSSSLTAAVAGILAVAACSASSPDPGSDAGAKTSLPWVTLATPKQFPPSEPGYLAVRPSALALTLGASAALKAAVVASNGDPVASAGPFTWTSSAPGVATIDATGKVKAIGAGVATMAVVDPRYGESAVDVIVTTSAAPTGPYSFAGDPPVLELAVGETKPASFVVADAAGALIVPAPPLSFGQGGPGSVEIADGSLKGVRPGVVIVSAASGGAALAGLSAIHVVPAPTAQKNGQCDPALVFDGCVVTSSPNIFSKPGLSELVRVWVWRSGQVASTGLCAGVTVLTQEAPAQMRSQGADGVVTVDADGLLTSVGPGAANVTAWAVRDPATNEMVPCGYFGAPPHPAFPAPPPLRVGLDLQGSWTASCKNGDTGGAKVGSWPAWVTHLAVYGSEAGTQSGGEGPGLIETTGSSCFTGTEAPPFTCSASEDLRGNPFGTFHIGPSDLGACTESFPCVNGGGPDCARARHSGPDAVFGKDHYSAAGCDYTRGGGTCGNPCDGKYVVTGKASDSPGCRADCGGRDFSLSFDVTEGVVSADLPNATLDPSSCTISVPVKLTHCGGNHSTTLNLATGECTDWGDCADVATGKCGCVYSKPCTVTRL